jgi:hypothetical protein
MPYHSMDRSGRFVEHEGQVMTFITGAKLAVVTALLLGATSGIALAHTAEQEQLCTGDAMRLCSAEIPDVGRVTACMIQKKALLSEGCKSVFQTPTPVNYQPARPSKPVSLVPKNIR